MGSFDKRSQKIVQSFAKIMNVAGISLPFLAMKSAILVIPHAEWEMSSYSNNYAKKILLTFQNYDVKKIVTIDPHAYNTFKNEYPEFGLEAEVYHHTELIWKWIQEGRIQPVEGSY